MVIDASDGAAAGGWPHHLVLGVTNSPGDAHALRSHARVDARYQYLSGGVNTGRWLDDWNPNGTLPRCTCANRFAPHMIPVLTFYEMLQSKPSVGGDEPPEDLSNLRNRGDDGRLLAGLQPAAAQGRAGGRRAHVVIHVEPDLWGYLEQARATKLARSFAQQPDRAAQQARAARAARVASEHVGNGGGPHLLQALAGAHGRARGRVGGVLRVAARARSTWSSTTSPIATPASTSTSRATRTPGGGRPISPPRRVHRRIHPPHPQAVVLWQLPVGDTNLNDTWDHYQRQPPAVVAGQSDRRASEARPATPACRAAVRRRRRRDHRGQRPTAGCSTASHAATRRTR